MGLWKSHVCLGDILEESRQLNLDVLNWEGYFLSPTKTHLESKPCCGYWRKLSERISSLAANVTCGH